MRSNHKSGQRIGAPKQRALQLDEGKIGLGFNAARYVSSV